MTFGIPGRCFKTAFELIAEVAVLSIPKVRFLSALFLKLPCPMRLSVLNSREAVEII